MGCGACRWPSGRWRRPTATAKALRAELGLPRETEDYDAFLGEVWAVAGRLALEMLTEAPDAPRLHARIVFAWRARHLGPKVAADDLKRAREQGWADKVFDPAGRPLPPPPPSELRRWIEAEVAAMGAGGNRFTLNSITPNQVMAGRDPATGRLRAFRRPCPRVAPEDYGRLAAAPKCFSPATDL